MSWSKCCYLYQKEKEGLFVGDAKEGELIVTYKDAPLTVNFYLPEGRYGISRIQACVMVDLEQEYELTLSAWAKSGGLLAFLGEGGFDSEVSRRFHTNNEAVTKQVLTDPNLKKALQHSPDIQLEVNPGPEGTHMLRVYVLNPERPGSGWPVCAVDNDYAAALPNESEIRTLFFPCMERLLDVTKAARDAVMNWNK